MSNSLAPNYTYRDLPRGSSLLHVRADRWIHRAVGVTRVRLVQSGLVSQTGSRSLCALFNIIWTSFIEGLCCLVGLDSELVLKL